jgi:hypothetical protein
MRFIYSESQIAFLREQFPKLGVEALANKFNLKFGLNKTPNQVRATLKNHKIRCGRKVGVLKTPRTYTLEMHNFIEENYKTHSRLDLAQAVNSRFSVQLTGHQIASYCKRKGISSGRTGHFPTGNNPWNNNTKGVMKPNSGSFQLGSIPANVNDFGHERTCKKDGYILIKVENGNPYTGRRGRYIHKHRHVWQLHHGEIPEGKLVSFKDGNKLNFDIHNLELIDRGLLCRFNKQQLSKAPGEIKPVLRTLIKLEVSTRRAGKQK